MFETIPQSLIDIAAGILAIPVLGLAFLSLLSLYANTTGHWPGDAFSARRKPYPFRTVMVEVRLFTAELRRRMSPAKPWFEYARLENAKPDILQAVHGYILSRPDLDASQEYLLFFGVRETRLGGEVQSFVGLRKIYGDRTMIALPFSIRNELGRLIGPQNVWISHIFNRKDTAPDECSIRTSIVPNELSAHAQLDALRRYQSLEGTDTKRAVA
jgi:hypothetical protein